MKLFSYAASVEGEREGEYVDVIMIAGFVIAPAKMEALTTVKKGMLRNYPESEGYCNHVATVYEADAEMLGEIQEQVTFPTKKAVDNEFVWPESL